MSRSGKGDTNRNRGLTLLALVGVANIFLWLLARAIAGRHGILIGACVLAYGLGLRHAVDADHISAIDNTTRKLMRDGGRPIGVGFYFSIGHSSVVLLLCTGLAYSAALVQAHIPSLQRVGSVAGTAVSAAFLFLIGIVNLVVLIDLFRCYVALRRGGDPASDQIDSLASQRGLIARILRPLLALVRRSWQMLLVGFLFGLGFDTSSEVAILAISARSGESHSPVLAILLLPLLFAAGMCLVDTADGLFMLEAYGWAFLDPARKLFYNLVITGLSVLVAFGVGAVEVVQIMTSTLPHATASSLQLFRWIQYLSLDKAGYGVVLLFAIAWLASVAIFRIKRWIAPEMPTSDLA